MIELSPNKFEALERLSNQNNIIGALAIDQRGSLKKMINSVSKEFIGDEGIIKFKELISEELTPLASSILLDPEYGLPASKKRAKNAGLILAYEKTGYDASEQGRLPDLLDEWSVKRLKEQGADAVKFLLYYDVDEDVEINQYKHVYMERIGSECMAEDIPFFLEIVTYDTNIDDAKSVEYAKVKPEKVIEAMKEFSKSRYHVDVLKVEVPVNMNYVEGYGEKVIFTHDETLDFFKEQSEATQLPFIFLSAGVSAKLFQETLKFAHDAGSTFNGVLCGRATWKNGVEVFGAKGYESGRDWLSSEGRKNIEELNNVLNQTASSWKEKVNLKMNV
jgi:tagatose 1,6-diphosphate aldolase